MKTLKSRVSVPENYTDKQDNDKTFWHDIGTITTFIHESGKKNSELFIPAYGLKAQVFAIIPKDNAPEPEEDLTVEPLPESEVNA